VVVSMDKTEVMGGRHEPESSLRVAMLQVTHFRYLTGSRLEQITTVKKRPTTMFGEIWKPYPSRLPGHQIMRVTGLIIESIPVDWTSISPNSFFA
jgi:hypothetical protein